MGHVYAGIPKDLVLEILKEEKIRSFVETGTYLGNTVIWAAQHFEQAFTIEIMEEFSVKASKRQDASKNIRFCVGNSIDVLPTIVKEINDNTLFWLDGHYSGQGTGGSENECPVMDEIRIASACKNAVILIDDARCFYGPPPPPHKADQWPSIADIFLQLNKYFPHHYGTIVDDVIFCIPEKFKKILDADWLKHFDERFSNNEVLLQAESKSIFKKIKSAFSNT